MNTPYGRRGAICKNLGWTWHYLHHGIPYSILQRILIDLPQYHYDKDHSQDTVTQITEENADEIMAQIQAML